MLSLIQIIAPVFLLIALGYGLGRGQVFSPDQVRGFGRLVLLVALPALIFNALANARMATVFRPDYLLVYGLASLGSFALGYGWFRRQADVATSAVRALGMSCSNTAFVGLPILTQLLGAAAAGPVALNMLIENLVMMPLVLALVEAGRSRHSHPLRMAKTIAGGLVRTPMLIAIVLGGLFSVAGLALPAPAAKAVGILAGASAPLALMTIGASLAGVSLHGRRGSIAAITLGKLVVHPLLVLGVLMLVPVADPQFHMAVLLLAAM
ncbi:MAG TPA: AEC family transporter, partial [Novosphingobium sp.]|nr:AEC family transporter [Novosphingobium sp.]